VSDPLDHELATDLATARQLVVRRAEALAAMRACAASLAEDPKLRAAPRTECSPRVRAAYRQLLEAQLVLAGLPVVDHGLAESLEAAEAFHRAAARTDRWAAIGLGGTVVAAAAAAVWTGAEVVLGVLTIGGGAAYKVRRDAREDRRQAESDTAQVLAAAGLVGTTTATELRHLTDSRRAAVEALDAAVETCAAFRDAEPAEALPVVETAIAAEAWDELLDVDAALLDLGRKHGHAVRHPGDVVAALGRDRSEPSR
jgi:hypothetical protein